MITSWISWMVLNFLLFWIFRCMSFFRYPLYMTRVMYLFGKRNYNTIVTLVCYLQVVKPIISFTMAWSHSFIFPRVHIWEGKYVAKNVPLVKLSVALTFSPSRIRQVPLVPQADRMAAGHFCGKATDREWGLNIFMSWGHLPVATCRIAFHVAMIWLR